jgi:hypothetical protein
MKGMDAKYNSNKIYNLGYEDGYRGNTYNYRLGYARGSCREEYDKGKREGARDYWKHKSIVGVMLP